MTNYPVAFILLAICLLALNLKKAYYYVPVKELKRKAQAGDSLQRNLYRAVSFGSSLQVFLWLIIGLTGASGFVILAQVAPPLLSLLVVAFLLWFAFAWQPTTEMAAMSARLAAVCSPVIVGILNYLHPVLDRFTSLIRKYRHGASWHTGLYEREDLLELLAHQKVQPDSRIMADQIELAERALTFNEHYVREVLVPRSEVQAVGVSDAVGPLLYDELHKSGHVRFPVYDGAHTNIVGTLLFEDILDAKKGGTVRDFMNPTVYYLHESDSLAEALHAFYKTNCSLFVVVNSFEEYVGIVTIKSLIRQLLGHLPGDDFEVYADKAAVAARHPKTKKLKQPEPEAELQSIN